MAILHLENITNKQAIGNITCFTCGGDLKPTNKTKMTGKIISIFIKDKLKKRHYECNNCKKKYTVI